MSICKVEMDLGLESGEKLIGTHPPRLTSGQAQADLCSNFSFSLLLNVKMMLWALLV